MQNHHSQDFENLFSIQVIYDRAKAAPWGGGGMQGSWRGLHISCNLVISRDYGRTHCQKALQSFPMCLFWFSPKESSPPLGSITLLSIRLTVGFVWFGLILFGFWSSLAIMGHSRHQCFCLWLLLMGELVFGGGGGRGTAFFTLEAGEKSIDHVSIAVLNRAFLRGKFRGVRTSRF